MKLYSTGIEIYEKVITKDLKRTKLRFSEGAKGTDLEKLFGELLKGKTKLLEVWELQISYNYVFTKDILDVLIKNKFALIYSTFKNIKDLNEGYNIEALVYLLNITAEGVTIEGHLNYTNEEDLNERMELFAGDSDSKKDAVSSPAYIQINNNKQNVKTVTDILKFFPEDRYEILDKNEDAIILD